MGFTSNYSVPQEARKLLEEGILENPSMSSLPADLKTLAKHVRFEGADKPSVPINWRFAESVSALKALEATMLNALLIRKYGTSPANITINTDHASLFFMSPVLAQLVHPDGQRSPINIFDGSISKLFPNQDKHRSSSGLHRSLATNIYKTKDGRYYHIHGGMNPDPTLTALGLPLDGSPDDTFEVVVDRFQKAVSQLDALELDELINEKYRQAGTVAWTTEEYFASEHGQSNSHIGLYEVEKDPKSSQPPAWWPDNKSLPSSPKRPLAGLKVLDLSRVIAGPTITRTLAEMGASVIRITSSTVTDVSVLHLDMNWGKWNTSLNLKTDDGKEALKNLIKETDVIVDGYRPGVMERLGCGREAVFDLVKDRPYGIIYVRENCYGWYGPWSHRIGWQQISDACCGISRSFSQAMGQDEAVTPVFPNSDFCTGISGTIGVLDALIQRAEKGGSYCVDTALNYYSQWLAHSCDTYPDDVWQELWQRHGSPVYRHYHPILYLIPIVMKLLEEHDADTLFNPSFFEPRLSKAMDTTFIQVKPIAQFENNVVELKYNVGTRGNGVDKPLWPEDLTVEIVQ